MYKTDEKKIMRKNERPIVAFALCCLLAGGALFAGGCGKSAISTITGGNAVFKIGSEKCSEGDARVILLNYQKDYATLYGVDMWAHDYEDGESLEDYVKDLTISQLAEVYTLDMIAEEQELTLSEDETAQTEAAAKEYLEGLSDAEKEYLDVSESDVQKLYERYLLAKKQYASLTESVSTEVSDDEARIMVMKKITVSDEDTAKSIVANMDAGTDFETVSASYADQTESVNVSRTTYDEEVTEALFLLNTGEHSDVFSIDGSYCVFYCENTFDAELTEQNKEAVLTQRMDDAVNSTYAAYTEQLSSELNEDTWGEITVDSSLELTGASFMEVYDAYFESF